MLETSTGYLIPRSWAPFGRAGPTILDRSPFLAGDPDDLESFSTELGLELAEVRDRLLALLAPAPPEVEQDQIGVDVVERDHFAVQAGKLKIDETAFGGVDLTDGLGHRGIERWSSAGKQPGQARFGWLALAGERDHLRVVLELASPSARRTDSSIGTSARLNEISRQVGLGRGSAEPSGSGESVAFVESRSLEDSEDRLPDDDFGAAAPSELRCSDRGVIRLRTRRSRWSARTIPGDWRARAARSPRGSAEAPVRPADPLDR